jgi:hypothetical protein
VSRQTLEQAIRSAEDIADKLMGSSPNDKRLDELQNMVDFLRLVLTKDPSEMQQDGASNVEDYTDDAVLPEYATKIKEYVNRISKMLIGTRESKSAPQGIPAVASGNDNFVMNDEVEGGGKEIEVPRLAAAKDPAVAEPDPAPAPMPPAAGENSATDTEVLQMIPTDVLLKVVADLSKRDDFQTNPVVGNVVIRLTQILQSRPVEAEPVEEGAVPAAAPAAPVAAPKASYNMSLFAGLKLASPAGDGGSWVTGEGKGDVLEDGGRTPEIAQAHAMRDDKTGIDRPKTDSVQKFAASQQDLDEFEQYLQQCTDTQVQGVYDKERAAGRDEYADLAVAEARSRGISLTASSKVAADMTTSKAVKLSERVGEQLKALFFEAKPITNANDSRLVRDAVDSIFGAYEMMGNATKVLNKQVMQEEAEQAAIEIKEKNKKAASLFGLSLAAEE